MIKNPPPWPNGARCAVSLTFDEDADSILHLAHHSSAHNRVAASSMLRYGPEIATPRILDMYRRFGLRQTFFVPAWCIERYPHTMEMILRDGHEIGHHGYLHEHPNELPEDQQIYWIQRASEVIEKFTGKKPRGMRAPTYKFSSTTINHLVDGGFDYDASLMGNDVPYLLSNGRGSVVELPTHYGVDDFPHYMASRDFNYIMPIKATTQAMEGFRAEFDAAWEYGGMFVPIWHPFLSGRLARAHAISQFIEYMLNKGKVWFAPMEEIAAHVRSLVAQNLWQPHVDRMPHYDGPIPELGTVAPSLSR